METTRPNPNLAPKMQFLESSNNISAHRKMVDSAEFRRAIDYASRHYVRALCGIAPTDLMQPNHVVASGMCFQRIQGMQDFITALVNLSEVPPTKTGKPSDNLEN